MPYDVTVPNATHSPAQDYQIMQQNFLQLQTSFSQNHTLLGGNPNGFHTFINFSDALLNDPASPPSSYSNIYTKLLGNAATLFFQTAQAKFPIFPNPKPAINDTTNSSYFFNLGSMLFYYGTPPASNPAGFWALTFDPVFLAQPVLLCNTYDILLNSATQIKISTTSQPFPGTFSFLAFGPFTPTN